MAQLPGALSWDLLVTTGLSAAAVAYGVGVARLWRHAGPGRGLRWWEVVAFAAAWLTLALALISPLDALADRLFAAHMTQHELLMLVAAPLLVLGRPLVAMTWALPARARRALPGVRGPVVLATWRALTAPTTVLLLHGAVVWSWHLPSLFEAALHHDGVHAVQHAGFFWTAALFWWCLAHGRYGRLGYGVAVLFVFVTAMHQGVLGALMTFASRPWYPTYATTQGAAALEDQQLAGLVMWVPAGVVFVVLGVALFAAWLGEAERRTRLAGHGRAPGARVHG